MEGRKNIEEFYRKLKVGTKLKYAFTTVIVTFAVAMVVSLVSVSYTHLTLPTNSLV